MAHIGIGRLDNSKLVECADNATISSVLAANGYTRADNECIQNVSGDEFSGSETIEDGQSYYLVQRVKSGMY